MKNVVQEQSRCAWQQGCITQLTHQLASLQAELTHLKAAQPSHEEQDLLQTQVCTLQLLHLCRNTVDLLRCIWNVIYGSFQHLGQSPPSKLLTAYIKQSPLSGTAAALQYDA